MNESAKLVSVLISAYNSAHYIEQSLSSILNQSYSNLELLVMDDGSEDSTPEILRRLSLSDRRIRVFRQENHGLTPSLNLLFKHARGDFIARQDADDISLPTRLASQLSFLQQFPDIALCGTAASLIDRSGSILGLAQVVGGHEVISKTLLKRNPMLHGSLLLRASVFSDIGGYSECLTSAQDYDLYLRLIKRYRIDNLRDPLYQLRIHENSISREKAYEQALCAEVARVWHKRSARDLTSPIPRSVFVDLRSTLEQGRSGEELRATAALNTGWYYMQMGETLRSISLFFRSFLIKPSHYSVYHIVQAFGRCIWRNIFALCGR